MATKWKSSILIYLWAFLLTFSLSGILTLFSTGTKYMNRDFFHTPDFNSELDQFAGYLSMFELNETTPDEAKAAITVTKDEIDEHRYRYGGLDQQISNIRAQYESRIQDAQAAKNDDIANALIKERDAKIEDISNNFASDDWVKPKVVKEKETKIDEYFKKRDQFKYDFLRYQKEFTYYFKDPETGKVYSNQNNDNQLKQKDMLYLTDFSITNDYFIHYGPGGYEDLADVLGVNTQKTLEGQIGIAKTLSASSPLMDQYKDFKRNQLIVLSYCLAGIIGLLLSRYFSKKITAVNAQLESWRSYYNKLPIDIRVGLFLLTALLAVIFIFVVNDNFYNIYNNLYILATEIGIGLLGTSIFVAFAYVQWKFLLVDLKSWTRLKAEWQKSLSVKTWRSGKKVFKSVRTTIVEAFLDQSTGTQIFILLAAVFFIGAAALMVAINPIFVVFYILLLAVAGFPLGMFLFKKVGYFNRIFQKTNELAAGKLGEDLNVTGKSVLATLAGNINVLKQGVKHSQSEQAKSERLKTELITNVSHDLRTPLTSIITYTELLKGNDVSEEEKSAYLEIIDRKSKRLKVLIDDLFEVSKMASGSVELVKEKVDLDQLLQQALAEYDETIRASSLQFRVNQAGQPIYALVDGQKLWRVFDNLIGNILKYSHENTRVYISIKTVEHQALITFKNVSKYELSDNVDELFERFKRGDTSRHTDGSGLGLAIVKSIIDLHDGKLDIEADGDLFKVIITLRLAD
ncbi:sensor histidine kinase [Neobacillus rhizophilus]|uniref:histidine kinase n=1 Tax=Neobacillus rhizophilus TaxID=2833579 RepID=A0A942YSW6_9BACI|nr:HAMP domain-containing sensor histidine kinase [Neobacillus rhizophilus]MBS4211287.1 GHKL domain-containing protein [Neobacillus rhizophilus]MBU8918809.1 HAMP domain-containing histidine kinase [Bacillus sp. FJAT-29953]